MMFVPQQHVRQTSLVTSPVNFVPMGPVPMQNVPSASSNISSPVSLTSSRRSSTSYIDEATVSKYHYPARQYAFPMPPTTYLQATAINPSAANPYLAQYVASTSNTPSAYGQHSRSQSLASDFSVEMPVAQVPSAMTTTLLTYLTSPNPSPNLVRHIDTSIGRSIRNQGNTHFWWDIRNLRTWKSFNLESVHAVPSLTQLLSTHISSDNLPMPFSSRESLDPENEQALHRLCRDFYAEKITSALKVALGEPNLAMRSYSQLPAAAKPTNKQPPEFVSNYVHEFSGRIFGEGKGRVVGLVKSFHRWNSGMRNEGPQKKVEYLHGLSHLHRHMREHGTRYGFIITEIELVCVSLICGPNGDTPLFGGLLLSPAIPLKNQSPTDLTACLALFYLHFLAKNHPPPGCPSYRVEVGGPSACTRQNCVPEKEKWIPEPQMGEKREAKRVRGWVWPTEPLNRKELPKRNMK
jgi:hypothetical protein